MPRKLVWLVGWSVVWLVSWLVSYRAAVTQTLPPFLHASQPPVAIYSYNLLHIAALNRCLAAKRYILLTKTQSVVKQSKATWTGLEVRLLEFLDNRHMHLARLSALSTDRLYS